MPLVAPTLPAWTPGDRRQRELHKHVVAMRRRFPCQGCAALTILLAQQTEVTDRLYQELADAKGVPVDTLRQRAFTTKRETKTLTDSDDGYGDRCPYCGKSWERVRATKYCGVGTIYRLQGKQSHIRNCRAKIAKKEKKEKKETEGNE